MADISYTQDEGGYRLATGPGPSFTAPPGGDMSGFFERLAAKKAAEKKAQMEEDRRRWEAEFRLKEQGMRPQEVQAPQAPQAPQGGYVDVFTSGGKKTGRAWSMDPAIVAAGKYYGG